MKVAMRAFAVCGPGLEGFDVARPVLAGATPWNGGAGCDPAPAGLPANERRRLPQTARFALAVGFEALERSGVFPRDVATVFASCGSDGDISHQICDTLARDPRQTSPTRFHNSVHNAPAGYFGIALGAAGASTALCGGAATFAVALLEAAAQALAEAREVLLIAYDVPYPAPLSSLWDAGMPFACALVLAPAAGEPAPRLAMRVGGAPPSPWPAHLPAALARNPAAASVPLLALLARDEAGVCTLPYHGARSLEVEVQR